MTPNITYNLLVDNNPSNFYADLSGFTDDVLKEASDLSSLVEDYQAYIVQSKIEPVRSKNEYLLELIMTGILWHNYILKAEKTTYLSKVVLKKLYRMRQNNATLKPITDKVRGYLAYELLNPQKSGLIENYTLASFKNLLEWLNATGEFSEEIIRLQQWIAFYELKSPKDIEKLLKTAVSFSVIFEKLGKKWVGQYTTSVSSFVGKASVSYAHREDYFLAIRRENEYFLNMFGAEIMNRQMRQAFENTTKKAVLLPTCMRTEPADKCKAKSDGKELVCAKCNKDCNIGKITASSNSEQITTYLIPHSSDFSKFLVKWKNNSETGLVGVACVLNLLRGGYEMKRLGIASQCVFLDYCGCKKHWDDNGIATNMNINRLLDILVSKQVKETSAHS